MVPVARSAFSQRFDGERYAARLGLYSSWPWLPRGIMIVMVKITQVIGKFGRGPGVPIFEQLKQDNEPTKALS